MQRRSEFSFQGLPACSAERAPALPPRPRTNPMAPRTPGEEEIRWLQASRQGSPDSGAAGSGTPPSLQLWAHHHDHHRLYPASAGSSPSREQAIAGYRREMLDLVRGLPESAYELSLRDIVERPSSSPLPPPPPSSATDAAARDHDEPADAKKDAVAADVEEEGKKQSGGSKKQGRRKQRTTREQRSRSFGRSVSLDTGLLIKLFLPLSIGGGGKKKVSPKPDAAKKKKEKTKQGKKREGAAATQEEWWTKSEFSEAASSSWTSSTGSSNSTGSIRNANGNGNGNSSSNPRAPVRSRSRKRTGCYAFFRANKSNNGVCQD